MKLVNRFHFSSIDSTQLWAFRELEAGRLTTGSVLVSASEQAAGKGQKDHRWHSPAGCLMFSLLFSTAQFQIPLSRTPLLGLAAGVALLETTRKILPPEKAERLAIHWPNDLYCRWESDGWRKMAGILLEGHVSGTMIAGMGINLLNSTRDAQFEVKDRLISLNDLFPEWTKAPALKNAIPLRNPGFPKPMERFLTLLLEELELKLYETAQNPVSIVRKTEKYCVQCGKTITLETPHGNVTGFCDGLADDGAILIDGQAFHTGSVPF